MPETPSAGEVAVATVGDLVTGAMLTGVIVTAVYAIVRLRALHRRRLDVVRRATEREERALVDYLVENAPSASLDLPRQRDEEL